VTFTEVHLGQVHLQDLGLAVLSLELEGQLDLLDLGEHGVGGVEVLAELLVQRRPAGIGAASGEAGSGAYDAQGIQAVVGVEAAVLGGDDRCPDPVRPGHRVRVGRAVRGEPGRHPLLGVGDRRRQGP